MSMSASLRTLALASALLAIGGSTVLAWGPPPFLPQDFAPAPALRGGAPSLTAIPKKLPPNVTTGAAADPAAAQAPLPELHRTQREAMGTIWQISISGGDPKAAEAAANRALDEVDRLEKIMSEWLPDSEISKVNAAAGDKPVAVGPDLLAVLKASLDAARWSHGAYDISWAALRDLWDFSSKSQQKPPSAEAVKARLPLWNYRNIALDEKAGTVFLKKRGMQIGLGGIAKGYALDSASEIIQQAGFKDFRIFGGGQVLVHGMRGNRMWRVGIQHPRDSSYFAFVDVTDASVSTSGDYEHSYFYQGKRYHHIIDPATGFPSEKTASVTVIAKSALWADAVDTAVFVMGPDKGLKALAKAPGGAIDGIAVDPSLHVFATPGASKRLVFSTHLNAGDTIGTPLEPGEPIPKLSAASIK
jgi:thiamine biosynthesis lipoprotein